MILLVHLALCWFMTGLVWVIQLVHYPSFDFVEEPFPVFEAFHTQAITRIVGPVMLAELLTALAVVQVLPGIWGWINLGILVLIWLSTVFWSIPCHRKLSNGKDAVQIRRLVRTNWPRTILWSLRAVVLLILAGQT